jgi:serine/threonine protein kinase
MPDRLSLTPLIEIPRKAYSRSRAAQSIFAHVFAPPERLTAALVDRYRIERELGAGGMATVYLAQDLKHDRKVALKVLKPELAAVLGAERFVVEIKTTASLQHPHILPLFDSGTADGFLFYVMPFIEGETLRDKLNRETQLGVEEAVRIAREVADALDYAHGKGVIHRDIKPENILIQGGRPMIADFGIALAVSAAAGGRMTETGLSLGTPHYMSPEQATADKEITGRSDIYSLASVLYEMLAGQPPHLGGSAQQIIMKIIAEPVQPVTALRKSVPPNVSAALTKALEKLPADRFENAKAFATALADPSFATTGSTQLRSGPGIASPEARVWRRIGIATSVVAFGSIAALAFAASRKEPGPPVIRVTLPFPGAARFNSFNAAVFDVSRDGSRIVYMGQEAGTDNLWVRDLKALAPRALPKTARASNPFFSPDGKRVAFVAPPLAGTRATGQLLVTSVDDGTQVTLVTDSVGTHGGHWADDDYLYFPRVDGSIARVPANGGAVEVLSERDNTPPIRYRFPQLLPGGKSLLIHLSGSDAEQDELAILELRTKRVTPLFRAFNGRFVETGHIVFSAADGSLFAVPFDPDRGAVTGVRVALNDAALNMAGNFARFTISPSGTLVYQQAQPENGQLVWVDREGRATPVDSSWRGYLRGPALSPDGARLAVMVRQGGSQSQIWVRPLPSGPRTLVSFASRENWRPRWTRDGRRVSFLSGSGPADLALVVRRFDASDRGDTLLPASGALSEIEWHPDGQTAILRVGNLVGTRDILRFTPGTDTAPKVILGGTQDELGPTISPDGKWLAYLSNESGRPEIYVRPFDDPSSGRTPVSVDGASVPVWSRDGKELFWRGPDGASMYVADVRTGARFSAGEPRLLFSRNEYVWEYFARSFDVSLDGKRFLMVSTAGSQTDEMVLVLNLSAQLRAIR